MLDKVTSENRLDEQAEIDQIRALLVGEIQRANERKLDELDDKLREFRQALERQVAQAAASAARSQANLVRSLGMAVTELGQHIVRLAEEPAKDAAGHE